MKNKLATFFQVLRAGLLLFLLAVIGIATASAQSDPGLRQTESQEISADDFLASDASRYFQSGNYEKALVGFNQLAKNFPKDTLIQRYRAVALVRLGKTQEGIVELEALVNEDKSNPALHYFLGEAYSKAGRSSDAQREWQWVLKNNPESTYGEVLRSEKGLGHDFAMPSEKQVEKPKRWFVTARYGYEYDSNVAVKPSDKSVASIRDASAGRHVLDFSGRYRLIAKSNDTLDVLYGMRQTLHDDGLDQFNFHSEEFGLNWLHQSKIRDQDVTYGLRYAYTLDFLGGNLYDQNNEWQASLDTRFTEYTETVFYDRFETNNYGPDGFDPKITSRDGVGNEVGVSQYFFTHDFRRYVFVRPEFDTYAARGRNFDSFGPAIKVGFHTPVFKRLTLDVMPSVTTRFYPRFQSTTTLDTSRRRDVIFDLYTYLTYALTKTLSVRAFYRWNTNENQNNLYDYGRHIGGIQFIYNRAG